MGEKFVEHDWSRAIHKVTLDHGGNACYANNCLLDIEKIKFMEILSSIDEIGLKPNPEPPIADILPIRKDSSFVFPFYDGCGIEMRRIFYVQIDIINLVENNEREIYTGSFTLADKVINMPRRKKKKLNEEDIGVLREEYDLREVSGLDDLMSGFTMDSKKDLREDYVGKDEINPYIVEMIVKGGVPREYIIFPHHVQEWMERN